MFNFNVKLMNVFRCNDNAQLFHHFKRFSIYTASSLESDSNECVGRCLYVLHIRLPSRICMRQLRGKKKAVTQCSLQTRRESCYSGQYFHSTKNYNNEKYFQPLLLSLKVNTYQCNTFLNNHPKSLILRNNRMTKFTWPNFWSGFSVIKNTYPIYLLATFWYGSSKYYS